MQVSKYITIRHVGIVAVNMQPLSAIIIMIHSGIFGIITHAVVQYSVPDVELMAVQVIGIVIYAQRPFRLHIYPRIFTAVRQVGMELRQLH